MSTYLLIHGAWHGGWCWRKVVPLLEAKGHKVLAPDLPGHGDDRTATATVTLKSYADRICEIASAQTKPVILAGHSMGGVAITQAAENCPKKIGALVYVCAFLPRNGDSLMTWATQDQGSMVNPSTTDQHADGTIDFKPEHSREAFFIECARDRAITHGLQREMQKASPCREAFSIDTDHSPFFSAPEKLADILSRIGSA
jgi:hypothetical protein